MPDDDDDRRDDTGAPDDTFRPRERSAGSTPPPPPIRVRSIAEPGPTRRRLGAMATPPPPPPSSPDRPPGTPPPGRPGGGVRDEIVLDPPVRHYVSTVDLTELGDLEIEIPSEHVTRILKDRVRAVTEVFTTLDTIRDDLSSLITQVPDSLPPKISGHLVNPDGRDAAHVSVRVLEPTGGTTVGDETIPASGPWPNPETRTDARGAFSVPLPHRLLPDAGLTLRVAGSNRAIDVVIRREDLLGIDGRLGTVPLDHEVTPLPRSALAELGDVVPTTEDDLLTNPEIFATPAPSFSLGEGDCARSFRSNTGVVDRFTYHMVVRLVPPHTSARRLVTRFRDGEQTYTLSTSSQDLSRYLDTGMLVEALGAHGTWELAERWPIEAPIDVARFLDDVERNPRAVPKAATLALGYVLGMRQVWNPAGLSLGDLVYSLPLAPGEQQRIAVSDEREALSVRELETLTAQEQQQYRESADTSTSAVFQSAFDEKAEGGSDMRTSSKAGAVGAGLGVGGIFKGIVAGLGVAGGYSSSTATGSSESWQKVSRDYASSAAQDFHSNLARASAARRSSARTSVRLASATERREVVTKVITNHNHNHNHALTMQYWQVLRHFTVTSLVDDVQLVCFVPLELIQWLPPDQPRRLSSSSPTRAQLLTRYAELLNHHDVLAGRVWRDAQHRRGLQALRDLAGHPEMTVESAAGRPRT